MSPPTVSLRRELLGYFIFLLAAALLLAALSLTLILPLLRDPRQAAGFLILLVLGDVAVVGLFGSIILRNRLVRPVQQLEADVARIAGGDAHHRLGPMHADELERIRVGVNAMADRLVRDQELLAENVASLDRTNRELLEARDQVTQAARLASAGSLASGIAHEVGNPLSAIMSYLDVAQRRLARGTLDEDLLDDIRDETRRIDQIVRTLLDYARPDADEEGVERVEVRDVVEGVRELMGRQGRLDAIEVRWELPESVPTVAGRPRALEQVLVNLLLNAADALRGVEDPVIDVVVAVDRPDAAGRPVRREDDPPGVDYAHRRRVAAMGASTATLAAAESVVSIRVRDNGPGVTEEARDRIFDPFFTTKDPGSGTGLGLSISARLVEGMGGRLEYRDSPDGGATFLVRLPAARTTEEES